jgi:NitT/TauT family transport system ATP-binding protein
MAEALLRLQDVTLEYANGGQVVRATHRVSLNLRQGERLVLLGPSGCGKSTLLKAAAGFAFPREGQVLFDGAPVRGPGPDRIVVFQEFDQLPPWKTVFDNVSFPLVVTRRLARADVRGRVEEALHLVGLSEFATAYPHQLSGGMKQRVAIARALAMQPRVLLMDEPFAALDALTRRKLQQELLMLGRRLQFTLLFVTHSIEEALIIGDRVAVLSARPGQVRDEIEAADFTVDSQGSAAFQASLQRLHDRLIAETTHT